MSPLEQIAYRSWYGPLRRPFRAIARRLTNEDSPIVWGPLKGLRFTGPELVCRMGIYELHVQYALKELIKPGDVFYDVGANNGYLSLLGARCVGAHGMVFSFEPLPQNSQRVQKLMRQNQIERAQLIEQAISDKAGTLEFYLGGDSDPYTPSLIRDRRSQAIEVEVTTLDEFVSAHRRPDVIKMDIEGAEVMALEGASTLLASDAAPKWLIEVHSDETDRGVKDILTNNGYQLRTLLSPFHHKPYPTHVIAWKKIS